MPATAALGIHTQGTTSSHFGLFPAWIYAACVRPRLCQSKTQLVPFLLQRASLHVGAPASNYLS
jgi:hypothetical protein